MNIVCGTNFSIHSHKAAMAAAALAARQGGTLSLVHVFDTRLYSNPSMELLKYLRDGRQRKLDDLAARARRRSANVNTHLPEGSSATELIKFASKAAARLLILSANGQIAFTKWFVPSVADQATQAADIPILLVREPAAIEAWAYGNRPLNVLIAYDFSVSAETAMRWAAALRDVAPCEISVAYVASAATERARLGAAPPMSPLYYPSGLKKFLEQELRQRCEAVLGEGMATVFVVPDWGRPDSHLIELAAEARMDLIVTGTSQRRGLGRLGSVSRAVMHYAPMNVLCVPVPPAGTPPPPRPPSERELVPLDFSGLDETPSASAFALANPEGEWRYASALGGTRCPSVWFGFSGINAAQGSPSNNHRRSQP